MAVIAVASPKGGAGKSTLSTQLAGYLASQTKPVFLGDLDRQLSARTWLSLRSDALARIATWEISRDNLAPLPKGDVNVVLDTPAGLHGKLLDAVMRMADKVLVPLQPSLFDIQATHEFIQQLRRHRRSERVQIALVGMRSREGTLATEQLRNFLANVNLPLLGYVRDTQNYVHMAAQGLTLWDVAPAKFERDLATWQPIIAWLDA